jgi:hypothetical protein
MNYMQRRGEKKNSRRKTRQHLAKEEVSCKTKYTDKNKKKFTNLVQFLQLAPPRLESSIALWNWPCTISMDLFRNRSEFRVARGGGGGGRGGGRGAGVDKSDSRTLLSFVLGFVIIFIFAKRSFRVGFPSMVVVVLGSSNAGHHVNFKNRNLTWFVGG